MKILCIVHADFELPGVIEDWAKKHQHPFSICKPYKGDDCNGNDDFDMLIVMGGPQSPHYMDKYPYLKNEIEVIKRAIVEDKKVLGFCLGAQLIGEAMGAKTERSPEKEIGIFPIDLTELGKRDPLFQGFPANFPVIHWHNDMPGETSTSSLLAKSEGCPKQIVKYGKNIYGFQCHLEITQEGMKTMVEHCLHDLVASQFTQSKEELVSQDYRAINEMMITILDRIVKL